MEMPWPGNVASYPELYDLLHDGNDNDVDFYSCLSAGHETVLECGIGSGRVAIPLAKLGRKVHGIDNSKQMPDEVAPKQWKVRALDRGGRRRAPSE